MNLQRSLVAVTLTLLLFLAAALFGARPHAPTQAELQKIADDRIDLCKKRTDDLSIDVAKSGTTIAMKNANRMFLTLPRDLYPEQNMQIEGDITMAIVENGETMDHKNEPCWTHYYTFTGAKGVDETRASLTILSNDLLLPDYVLHLIVTQ